MNHTKKALKLFVLSLSAMSTITQAIMVNDRELASIIKPGEALFYKNPSKNNIILILEKDSIQIGSIDLNNVDEAITYFNYLSDNKDKLYTQISDEKVALSSEASIQLKGAFISAPITELQAKTEVEIHDTLIQSEQVVVICNALEAHACYIDAHIIHIECNNPTSPIKIIRFIMNKDVSIPHALESLRQLNFKDQEVTGDLLVVGAQAVAFVFDPSLVS